MLSFTLTDIHKQWLAFSLQHPLCAWLTLFSQTWRKLSSCLLIYASPNCTCSWSSCCPDFKNRVPKPFLEAFLMSSSDADHIPSMKTEVWPWHLCKHIWLSCFLISNWRRSLPNSGACLWRGSSIKVSIQLCVFAKYLLLLDYLLKACKFASFLHPCLVEQKCLFRQLRKMKTVWGRHRDRVFISVILPWKWYLLTWRVSQPVLCNVMSAKALVTFQQIKVI